MVGAEVVEDPTLVEVVSKHRVEPCQEEVASRNLGVEAFLQENLDLVALVVCLMEGVAWVASGGTLVAQAGEVAFLLVEVRVEEACNHPSCQEEEEQE